MDSIQFIFHLSYITSQNQTLSKFQDEQAQKPLT